MRRPILVLLLVLACESSARSERVLVGAGIGMGELVHAELGYFVSPRSLVEARAGWLIFNPMVGLAFSYAWGANRFERPPRHGWLLRGELMVNPTLDDFHIEERGETIGAVAGVYAGHAFLSEGGFYVRSLLGVLIGKENDYIGPLGPNFTLTLGRAF